MANETPTAKMTHARWASLTEWPLTAAALVFLAVYAWQVIGRPGGALAQIGDLGTWSIWGAFALDYLVNLRLATNRRRWFVTHLHEFLIVALPMLRPLRLLRLVSLLTILNRAAGAAFRGSVIAYAAGSSVLIVLLGALAVLDAEQDAPTATITTFGNAMWWAIVTISTVGYGDLSPVTVMGRCIAVGIMIAGIALLGTVTATLASWFAEKVSASEIAAQDETQRDLEALTAEIAGLRELIIAGRL